MRPLLALTLLAATLAASATAAQEPRPVPNDSTRLTLVGCTRDRAFVVVPAPSLEAPTNGIEPGRRFRLNGPRRLMDEIRQRERTMVEVTGLVKKGDLSGPGGLTMMGGRIRIGGAPPRDAVRDPMANQIVIDVESYRSLPDACPER